MTLSVIIPVYNEEKSLHEIIRRVCATRLANQIIAVDDASEDNSLALLGDIKKFSPVPVKVLHHEKNRGKGAAIKTGLAEAEGELVLIQDADLEYSPENYKDLLPLFKDESVEVVYGSRNLVKNPRSTQAFYWGGRLLSLVTNILYGSKITDESTCYKVFRTDLLKDLKLEREGFDFCPEVTGKILKRKIKIHEVPIKYTPRSREEGKKIKWYHGIEAVLVLIKYRF